MVRGDGRDVLWLVCWVSQQREKLKCQVQALVKAKTLSTLSSDAIQADRQND